MSRISLVVLLQKVHLTTFDAAQTQLNWWIHAHSLSPAVDLMRVVQSKAMVLTTGDIDDPLVLLLELDTHRIKSDS